MHSNLYIHLINWYYNSSPQHRGCILALTWGTMGSYHTYMYASINSIPFQDYMTKKIKINKYRHGNKSGTLGRSHQTLYPKTDAMSKLYSCLMLITNNFMRTHFLIRYQTSGRRCEICTFLMKKYKKSHLIQWIDKEISIIRTYCRQKEEV